MTVDLLHPKGKSCKDCKHKSDYDSSEKVLKDFKHKGQYWRCNHRSYFDDDSMNFLKEVIIYTNGFGLCSSWEPKDKKR